MLNFTLTITAAPELLVVMKDFINSITAAKVETVPVLLQHQAPRQVQSQIPAHVPAQVPSQVHSQVPAQVPVQVHSQISTQVPSKAPAQLQVQVPVQAHQNVPSQPEHEVAAQMQLQLPSGADIGKEMQANAQQKTYYTQGSKVPAAAQSYTMEQLAVAATELVEAGLRTELINLLSTFGVQALTALPKEQYGAFGCQLKALGAKL